LKKSCNVTYLRPYLTILISNKIKNLVFDLGGVIIGLDTARTYMAFSELSGIPIQKLKEKIASVTFFNEYEKGLIPDTEFRNHLRAFLENPASDQQIDNIWNAMLLDISADHLNLLNKLKSVYRTFLLSNTNNIHLEEVNKAVFNASGEKSLDPFFHKAYFSHLMHQRKPDSEIFTSLLKENNLSAEETLFMDDMFENIQGAKSVGIQTIQITSINQVLSLFT